MPLGQAFAAKQELMANADNSHVTSNCSAPSSGQLWNPALLHAVGRRSASQTFTNSTVDDAQYRRCTQVLPCKGRNIPVRSEEDQPSTLRQAPVTFATSCNATLHPFFVTASGSNPDWWYIIEQLSFLWTWKCSNDTGVLHTHHTASFGKAVQLVWGSYTHTFRSWSLKMNWACPAAGVPGLSFPARVVPLPFQWELVDNQL